MSNGKSKIKAKSFTIHGKRSVLLCLLLLTSTATGLEPSLLFRARGDVPSIVADGSPDFVVRISNSVPDGICYIERSLTVVPTQWEPFMRTAFTNHLVAARVYARPPAPDMVFIPGGTFTRGDAVGDHSEALPLHQVTLRPLFMSRNEVTNEEMRQVYQWAYDEGYIDVVEVPVDGGWGGRMVINTVGSTNHLYALNRFAQELNFVNGQFTVLEGKSQHPCVYVTWYGAAAYGHFRSLMEGLESGLDLATWEFDFSKTGYRLPTDAEWEKAARGGYEGMRFPWGDTNVITHSRANYRSNSALNDYDVSPTQGFHPDYANQPLRTSPVGAFPPNNFGLYDMCGNVWEWCWDWRIRYFSAPLEDPTGPETGSYKGFRGGSNFTTAERTTVSKRYLSTTPSGFAFDVGFRCAMTFSP